MTSFYKLSGDRTQAHVFTDSTVCSYDGQLQCNGWICIVTCHFPKIRYVLPQPPSMCWANWRDDSRWCLFNLFQTLRHFLTCHTPSAPSPYTSTNCQWLLLGQQHVASIQSTSQYRLRCGTNFLVLLPLRINLSCQHQLIDWLLCHLLHVSAITKCCHL